MKRLQIGFIAIILAVMLIPAIGLIWAPTTTTTENRELAALPVPVTEPGQANVGYFSELGVWFEDHFAYRNQMVTLNAQLRLSLLGASASEQIIIGRDGWLFYNGELPDYLGTAPLSDGALRNIAHNLRLMQAYVESQGATFCFALAPNKSSIYPEMMPANYLASTAHSNAQRLQTYLDEYGVNSVDLQALLSAEAEENPETLLYLVSDTHWNNYGAFLGNEVISESLGIAPLDAPEEWMRRADYPSDLNRMLFPMGAPLDFQEYYFGINDQHIYYTGDDKQPGLVGQSWELVSVEKDDSGVADVLIKTSGPGSGSLLAYRDSFAIALIPYLATQTASATFSKLLPYDAMQINALNPDFVLLERAERHLNQLATTAPYCPSPRVRLNLQDPIVRDENLAASTMETEEEGVFITVSGLVADELINQYISKEARIIVSVNGENFEAFSLSDIVTGNNNQYRAYIPRAAVQSADGSLPEYRLYFVCTEGVFLAK